MYKLNKNIRYLRLENNLTQKELEKNVGLVERQIRRYEIEEIKNPGLLLLQKFSNEFGISIEFLTPLWLAYHIFSQYLFDYRL